MAVGRFIFYTTAPFALGDLFAPYSQKSYRLIMQESNAQVREQRAANLLNDMAAYHRRVRYIAAGILNFEESCIPIHSQASHLSPIPVMLGTIEPQVCGLVPPAFCKVFHVIELQFKRTPTSLVADGIDITAFALISLPNLSLDIGRDITTSLF